MRKIFLLIVLAASISFPQTDNHTAPNTLFTASNIMKFADYLFCTHDYLRAAGEFERYLSVAHSDTAQFKAALSYSLLGDYSEAFSRYDSIPESSSFYQVSRLEMLKSLLMTGRFNEMQKKFKMKGIKDSSFKHDAEKLRAFSYLISGGRLPERENILSPFQENQRESVSGFYDWLSDPPYKSPVAAAVLSAVIPGLGKFYTHQYGDGIYAFAATTVFGYLAYANFNAGHKFRGWLFSGLCAGFYAGNIYGSAASAQIYNVKIKFDFVNLLKNFLDDADYFIPKYDFCR